MAIREYKCSSCGIVMEQLIPTFQTPEPSLPCGKCGARADFRAIPSSFGLLTDNFQEQKLDVAIGKDADRRWQDVSDRQQIRNRVREETGQMGLSMVGRNEFVPLPDKEKAARTEGLDAVGSEGFKHQPDTQTDKKILGTD